MPADLHPGHEVAVDSSRPDHRDTHFRQQMREPSESLAMWKRTVESLAAELQCSPMEAHSLLLDGAYEMTKGLAWDWWL